MNLKRAIVAVVGCVLMATACSGTAATSASVAPTSAAPTLGAPCSLLTMAQVGSAISFTVNTQTSDDAGQTCTWTYADPNNMVDFNTARLSIIDLATFSKMRVAQDSGITITPVGNLGDAAFYTESGVQGTSLSVEKGSAAFTVWVLGKAYTAAQSKADENVLATEVLAGI